MKEEDEDKEEEIGVLEQSEGVKEEEEDEEEEEENTRPELKPIDEKERRLLAKAVAEEGTEAWKRLGKKLAFEADEVSLVKGS